MFISSSCTTLSPAFWFYSYWLDSLTTMWTFSSFRWTLVWSLMLSILIYVLLLINLWCLRRSFGCDCKWVTRTIICNMACARLKGLKRTKMHRVDYNFIVASLTLKWDIRHFICYNIRNNVNTSVGYIGFYRHHRLIGSPLLYILP